VKQIGGKQLAILIHIRSVPMGKRITVDIICSRDKYAQCRYNNNASGK